MLLLLILGKLQLQRYNDIQRGFIENLGVTNVLKFLMDGHADTHMYTSLSVSHTHARTHTRTHEAWWSLKHFIFPRGREISLI